MAKTIAICCIGQSVVDDLAKIFKDRGDRESLNLLEAIPVCSDDAVFGVCPKPAEIPKKKREPSEYNKFIGGCIKTQPKSKPIPDKMRACAAEWKGKKKK